MMKLTGSYCFGWLSMLFLIGWCSIAAAETGRNAAPTLAITVDGQGATITIDGELFTRYLIRSGTKPVLWPVIGPTGERVTRTFPLGERGEDEKADHPHHRSVWFGYEGINGPNFWSEPRDVDKPDARHGAQVHTDFVRAESNGRVATLVTTTDYQSAAGDVVAKDERTWRFGADADTRWIDFRMKLWSPRGPLVIADTKEGAFAVRVAGTMKVDAKRGGKIVSGNGDVDTAAWGKPAEWVDYHGPVAGETVGIAIMAHPTNHDPTPRWHVRTYGLFAVNPFGATTYSGGSETGGLEVAEGKEVFQRYRILIHKGDHEAADVAGEFARYAETD